jgi:hypothetical protein
LLNTQLGCNARLTVERRYEQGVAGDEFLDIWTRMVHQAQNG